MVYALKTKVKRWGTRYYNCWWFPAVILGALIVGYAPVLYIDARITGLQGADSEPIVIASSVFSFLIILAFLGTLSASIWSFIKKQWISGVFNLVVLPVSIIVMFLLVMFMMFVPARYAFSSGHVRTAEIKAEASLPDSTLRVQIAIQPMHPFLAEYHGWLCLSRNGKEIKRVGLFDDTGGYSLTNLYRTEPHQFVTVTFFNTLLIDSEQAIIEDLRSDSNIRQAMPPPGAVFLGAFDFDSNGDWRFFPASERVEQPIDQYHQLDN